MKKTTTVTYEYDDEGTLLSETTVEETDAPAVIPTTVPYPVPYPVYPQYQPYWYRPVYSQRNYPLYQTITCNALG